MIDAHVHVFAKNSREFPREVSQNLPADREEPVEKLLAHMDSSGVDQAVLVQIGGRDAAHHRYLQHCLKAHPNRFLGIGLIPEDAPSVEDHMDQVAENGQIIGFRLSSLGGPRDPLAPMDVTSFKTYPIWQHAAKKDYVLWLYPRAVDAHTVPFLIHAFPQVRVVFNHMLAAPGTGSFQWDEKGRPRVTFEQLPPQTRYATFGLHQYENVSVLLSGQYAFSQEEWPYRDLTEWHERLHAPKTRIQGFGADRLMWATDFPWIVEDPGYPKMVRVIDELLPDLSPSDRENIMGGAAKKVLRFPAV
jgi:predicted TIM-barrel fold metal-dependent hydrolase